MHKDTPWSPLSIKPNSSRIPYLDELGQTNLTVNRLFLIFDNFKDILAETVEWKAVDDDHLQGCLYIGNKPLLFHLNQIM